MSKPRIAPMDPETEIDRHGIVKLSGARVSRVVTVVQRDKWGFPKPVRKSNVGSLLYSLADITAWLKKNDLKTMVFVNADRGPVRDHAKAAKVISSAAAVQLMTGAKTVPFKGVGKTVRIRLEEHYEYQAPDPRLTKFSNSGAEHRYAGGNFE